jgi:hypothetical protein
MDPSTTRDPPSVQRQRRRRRGDELHLCIDEAVSYIDRTATRRARAHLEGHLLHCDACIREVIQVSLFLRDLERDAETEQLSGSRSPEEGP